MTRLTQAERRARTRRALIEATLDTIAEAGYAGASLNAILKAAGVSKGAWAHQFESKNALVVAAAEQMLLGSIDTAVSEIPGQITRSGADGLARLIEFLWRAFYQGRHRDVLFDLAAACRTDDQLRPQLMPVFQRFTATLERTFRVRFAGQRGGDPAEWLMLTLFMLRGMSMQDMLSRDETARLAALRQRWVTLMAPFIDIRPGEDHAHR